MIATHAGYRFKDDQAYMLRPDTIEKIADRGGVIGLILARHQLYHGLELERPDELSGAVEAIGKHIGAIHGVTESYEQIGIGSDLDGFIKPTVGGVEYAEDLGKLARELEKAFPAKRRRFSPEMP